jgi:hypothetical protein
LLLPHILLIDLTCMSVLLQSFVCIFAQIEHVYYKEVLYARPQTQY